MADSLQDRVVVVIGASSGIGRQTAVLFAREGASVRASARRVARLRDLAVELASAGCAIATHAADSTRVADMDGLMRATREQLGEIDARWFMPPAIMLRTGS